MRRIIFRFALLVVVAAVIGSGGWIAFDGLWPSQPMATSHAAESGDVEAARQAARAGNLDEAFVILDRLAWQGDRDAQYFLGDMYSAGLHVHANWEAAAMWWTRAAEQDHVDAAVRLASYYSYGNPRGSRRPDPQFEQAAYWFLRAAELGDGYGQARIGQMYIEGEGVDQDVELGREWLERAIADSNSRVAKYNLGKAYRDGVFGAPDDRLAAHWCLEGGKDGNVYSMRCAIHLMADSDSDAVDFESAYQWALVIEEWEVGLGFLTASRTADFVLHGDLEPAPRNMVLGQEIAPAQERDVEFPEPRLDAEGQARAKARAEAVLECWPEPPIGPDLSLEECYRRHGAI